MTRNPIHRFVLMKNQSIYVFILVALFTCQLSWANQEQAIQQEASATSQEKKENKEPQIMMLTLDQVIQKAVMINPLISSNEHSLEEAQALYLKAKRSSILPKVDFKLYGGVVPDTPPNVGPAFNFPDAGLFNTSDWGPFVRMKLEGIQPIYTFGKISNLQKAADQGVKAGEQGIIKARNEITLHATKAYYTLANLFSYLDFVKDLEERSEKAVDIVQEKLDKKSTEVTDIDLMRIEVFQSETRRRKIQILHNIDFLKMTIRILMGLPRDTPIDIADHRIRMEEKKVDVVEHFLQVAKDKRPELKQLDALVSAREFQMKEKKAQLLPSFGLAGEWEYGYAPGREDIDNPFLVNSFNIHSAGGTLFLSQNLAFHILNADYKKARASFEKAKADQQAAFQAIEIQIRNAHKETVAMYDSFEHSKVAFKKVRSWVLATTLNFGVGVVPPKELVEAFVAYSQVKNDYLDTLFDFKMAMANLSYAVGDFQ